MSKKKATMTLKDFHGGSIPSDLPLPSAPGIIRGGINQQTSWGNSVGRSDHRLRPASTGSARNLDEKTPFFNHSSHIGRNFDEDERKPLDGVSGPRRVVNDEIIRSQSVYAKDSKIDNQPGARVGSRPASVPVYQSSNPNYIGSCNHGLNYLNMGGNAGHAVAGSYPNAWGMGKELAGVKDPVSAAWSASEAATKLAHASALEKVSSGRWSSKPQVNPLKDVEFVGHQEPEGELKYNANSSYSKKTYNRVDLVGDSNSYDVAPMMHTERIDGIHGSRKELFMFERSGPTINMEPYMKNTYVTVSGSQPLQPSGRSDGTLSMLFSDSSKRPKLKLLPRSKPLENLEPIGDHKIIDHLRVEDSIAVQEAKSRVQSGFAEPVVGDRALERPKLNLKPRTQPLGQQLEGNSEVKRGMVFGGARPREVVLKERGIEEDVSHHDSPTPLRVKEGVLKVETMPTDPKLAKYSDRLDHQLDGEMQRKNRQNETRLSTKDNEKLHRNQQPKQLQQDRPRSPETWRKPVEHEKQASQDGPPLRYGKVTSAVELAQAFSKSVSKPTIKDRFSGPRGIPSRTNNQVPFSRLTGPAPRPQINGY